ncbi:A/G-specific adenine glycosylase [Fulvivirga kasyanovii]|uniref:Adenine DNA glycosylase n=1 Tax=Fulvivirga kasyanovii TaxID=396812 RepID=A0ABW9RTK5_9BACT|nr:A/G-specific adenine glycosylase [Fulvivirga kasyanovii]MTI27509.1 A/G-specific adenine glycosylase [Fulvivirga kasyanovii]
MDNKKFAKKLITWYNMHKRELPWRDTTDPYKIWLSEIILQQTRVVQGLPYYNRFVEHFEKIDELAAANEQEILRLWQGLGYYSRARNLHKCAKIVAENLGGKFPFGYKNLLKLPGIGKYTAAAIASFAFKERVAVIDGNVYRVLARVYGISDDISSGTGQRRFEELANELIPEDQPDVYNQAIMEFGATHCTPKSPACAECIFNIECHARIHDLQKELPVKLGKVKVKNRYFHYIVFKRGNDMAMKQRQDNDIWRGLYDYMLYEHDEFRDFDQLVNNDKFLSDLAPYIKEVEVSADYKHVLTHRRLHARFFTVDLERHEEVLSKISRQGLQFFDHDDIHELPKPVLVSRYLNDTIF